MKLQFGDSIGRELASRGLDLGSWARAAGVAPETASKAFHGRPVTITSGTRLMRALRATEPIDLPDDVLSELRAS